MGDPFNELKNQRSRHYNLIIAMDEVFHEFF